MNKKIRTAALILLLAAVFCTGCKKAETVKMAVTWGLAGDEIFQVEGDAMTAAEARVLLMTQLAEYRNLYGDAVLERSFGDSTLADNIRENTLELLGKIMILNQMAVKYQIYLTDEETAKTHQAAAEYYASLSEREKELTGADEEDIQRLIFRICMADRVFEELTSEEDIEVSDDEARVVTMRHIMIRTTEIGQDGTRQEFSPERKQEAYTNILKVFDRLQQGADFDAMAELYNEDVQTEYSVGRGALDVTLEEAVFAMESGQMSIVLESAEGYHIIYCVDNFDREATEQNKQKLISQRKWKVFEETYNTFAAQKNCEFSERHWEKVQINPQEAKNAGFLELYKNYFAEGLKGDN